MKQETATRTSDETAVRRVKPNNEKLKDLLIKLGIIDATYMTQNGVKILILD